MRRILSVTVIVFMAGFVPAAQQPTFRTEINYVELPVRVVDAKGNFVRDLKSGDFQIFEDGVPQKISSFSLVDLPKPVPPKAVSASETPAPQVMSVDSLQKLEGRLYLFIVDDYHIRPQYSFRARQLVQTFIKERMGASDAAAMVFTSGIRNQDFTQSRAALLAALARVNGTFDGDEPDAMKELKARSIVKTVADFSAALGAIKGRHKAVILVTPGVGCGMSMQATAESASAVGILCGQELRDATMRANKGDVTVYSLDPRGAQNPSYVSPGIDGGGGPDTARDKAQTAEGFGLNVFDGMHVLADDTGGFVVTGTNSFTKAFDRIVAENSSYYVVGYSSTNDKADGTMRKNAITVTRPDVQVLYRASYVAPR